MKKTSSLLVALMLVLTVVPYALANTPTIGGGTGITVVTEPFVPRIWMNPESRIVLRNPADLGDELVERVADYAFEGEQIQWEVLVMDKNGVEKISDVYVTIGTTQGIGNDIEANCDREQDADTRNMDRFNAMIDEEKITTFDADTMEIMLCTLTVETSASMYGEYFVTAEVEDLDGNQNTFDENEYWFFNPVVALSITGDIDFSTVRPGTLAYSDTLLVENDADSGSGVLLDMTISGTDFYDPGSTGAKCPLSNHLRLNSGGAPPDYEVEGPHNPAVDFVRTPQTNCDNPFYQEPGDVGDDLATENQFDVFCYWATNGAYKTSNDNTRRDNEGYVGIPYETGDEHERTPIISSTSVSDRIAFDGGKAYFAGNVLTPGDEIAITFRLALPEPCNGDFSEGQIMFWGTAI